MTRPKSAGDAVNLAKPDEVPEPMPSPTKGILMTPGTAAARRKTVTFGDHVVDNEKDKTKEGSKSGLPNDYPGKFPSPWVDKTERDEPTPGDRKRGRSKLTEELHKAREESAKRRADENMGQSNGDQDDVEPDSESGRYWKREYDMYRANTTREVKKLVTKQKAAKSYARDKDLQCTELSDQLRQEKKKVERLERRTAELEAQLKAFKVQIEDKESTSPARNARSLSRRRIPDVDGIASAARPAQTRSRSTDQPISLPQSELSQRPLESELKKSRKPLDTQADTAAPRSRVRHQPGNLPSDLWTHSVASPAPASPEKADEPSKSFRNGRAVTSGTNLTPLKSLSINTQQKTKASHHEATSRSHLAERKYGNYTLVEANDKDFEPPIQDADDAKRCDSLDLTVGDSPKIAAESDKAAPRHSPLLPSNPFEADVKPLPWRPATAEKALPPRPAPVVSAQSKENVSPSRAAFALQSGNKDTAESLQVPRVDKAGAARRDKDGREVSAERIAAAKARMAARGRNVP